MQGHRFVLTDSLPIPDAAVPHNGALVAPFDCQVVGFVFSAFNAHSTGLLIEEGELTGEVMLPNGFRKSEFIDHTAFLTTEGQPLRLKRGENVAYTVSVGANAQGVMVQMVCIEG
jgi:hypothetical protein